MFGKGKMSSTDSFVMAAGRKAGNLKAKAVPKVSDKAKPVAKKAEFKARTLHSTGPAFRK